MAELSETRLAALVSYVRPDDPQNPADLALLERFFHAAVGYLADSGVSDSDTDKTRQARIDLVVDAMVLDMYEHRDLKEPAAAVEENRTLRRMINQLKLTEVTGCTPLWTPVR